MQDLQKELYSQRKLLTECISYMKKVSRKLGKAEYDYRLALTKAEIALKVNGYEGEYGKTESCAWTMVGEIARGLPEVAELRLQRDLLKGDLEATMQKIYQCKIEIDLLQREIEAMRKGE